MRESAVIIDNACLIVYLIFKVIHDRDIGLDRLSSKSK